MGFKILENNKDKILEQLSDAIEEAFEAIGQNATNYARNNAPTDTGLLKNSITYAVGGKKTSIASYSDDSNTKTGVYLGNTEKERTPYVVIGTNVEYAPYQELGTRRTGGVGCNGGRGFLRPAINEHVAEFKEIIENALKNG